MHCPSLCSLAYQNIHVIMLFVSRIKDAHLILHRSKQINTSDTIYNECTKWTNDKKIRETSGLSYQYKVWIFCVVYNCVLVIVDRNFSRTAECQVSAPALIVTRTLQLICNLDRVKMFANPGTCVIILCHEAITDHYKYLIQYLRSYLEYFFI